MTMRLTRKTSEKVHKCLLCGRAMGKREHGARYPVAIGEWMTLCRFCSKTHTFDKYGALVIRN